MRTLKELQEGMQSYVLREEVSITDAVVKPDSMEATARLQVYRNAYYLRLIEILEGDYAVLSKLMGKDAFASMARDYLDAFPSHSFSVKNVGKNLATFLKNTELCDPSYAELAEFEWTLNRALFSEDASALALEDLAQVPSEAWPDLHLRLHPSVRLFQFRFNTAERWQSVSEDQGDIPSIPLPEPCDYLVWRRDHEAYFCTLSHEQNHLIRAIDQGESFGTLCETLLMYFDEEQVVPWVASTLQAWLVEGVFAVSVPITSHF